MTAQAWILSAFYVAVLALLAFPLGLFMAKIYRGEKTFLHVILGPIENAIYRLSGVDVSEEMSWKRYGFAVLLFNTLGFISCYALMRTQALLPLNPQALANVGPEVSFNTAVSFATNTNWQAYGGETTLSYLTQMLGLGVQNFLSAATGMAVLIAFLRGFMRKNTSTLGSFWVDLVRITLYVLLPLSFVLAIALVSQGVVQTFSPYATATLQETLTQADGQSVGEQILALGPAASQIAIKQLGTNGGGFFNVNSAHPFENPTPFSNFLELLSLLLIPAALCFTFGDLVRDRRQGWAIFGAMLLLLVPIMVFTISQEQGGNPTLSAGIDQAASALQSGGNMEGKETRFGPVESAIWATWTTAASNGSVNAMHDSFMPLGGLGPMWLMQLGEIVFGGVGSGLYGMLMYAIIAVFISGLMVGRTPEYLGKKIESFEMKMASLVILLPSAAVLLGAAIACVLDAGTSPLGNPGIHGFSEILYAFSSGANNNGSAFGGLTVSGPFYATAIGLCMWIGRFGVIVPVLAMAGSLAKKNAIPKSAGTLPTDTPLFVTVLVGTVVLVGALTFIPSLALGPIVEHLTMQLALIPSH